MFPVHFFKITDKVTGLLGSETQLLLQNHPVEKAPQAVHMEIFNSRFAAEVFPDGYS